MNRPIVSMLLIAIAALTLGACGRDEAAGRGEQTGTVARPDPMPGELGTDAMTQTVELEDGRSVDEGSGITTPEPEPAAAATTATTSTTTTARTKAPPTPRKQ